jgi:hypothetical protein
MFNFLQRLIEKWTRQQEKPKPPEPLPVVCVNLTILTEPGATVELHTGEKQKAVGGMALFACLIPGERGVTISAEGFEDRFLSIRPLDSDITVSAGLELKPKPPVNVPVPPPLMDLPTSFNPLEPSSGLRDFVFRVARESKHYAGAQAGSGLAAHLVCRDVVKVLRAYDSRWGMITKNAGEQQCSTTECGRHVRGGLGEDVVAFLPDGASRSQWVGFDIIAGAGELGAHVTWGGPLPIREGNQWTNEVN